MKQNSLKTRTTQWLSGSSMALAGAHSSHAATVMIDFADHDLSTTLDGLTIFNGISDMGQWRQYLYSSASFAVIASRAGYSAQTAIATGFTSFSNYAAGSQSNGGVRNASSTGATGLVAWDLSNGTKGWLHITSNPGLIVTADYFVFDDANDQVRPDHGGDSEAFAGVATTTLNAQAAPVPEPSSIALLALGAAGVMTRRKRN